MSSKMPALEFANDEFKMLNPEDFEQFINSYASAVSEVPWDMCITCNIKMTPLANNMSCNGCGRYAQVVDHGSGYSTTAAATHTTFANGPASYKIAGDGARPYNLALWSITTNRGPAQTNATMKQLLRYNANSTECKFPIHILHETAELYGKLQAGGMVRRGQGRNGSIAALLSHVSHTHDLTRKPKELAQYFNVPESAVSSADKYIRYMHEHGTIEIPVHYDPTRAYLTQYFDLLTIDEKYSQFAIDIIERTDKTPMCGDNNSRVSTKCAGIVYVLQLQLNLPFDKTAIERHCQISISTFMRYYEYLVINRKKIKDIFIAHGIKPLKKAVKRRAH